jgi:quercetin dioxygenase-like cupin family protein
MVVHKAAEVPQDKVEVEGAKGVSIRWLLSKKMGTPNFAMREFTVEPGGRTPLHTHEWEHEVYILEGEGVAVSTEGEKHLTAGSVVFVPVGELHQFRNTGGSEFKFLCLVPNSSY